MSEENIGKYVTAKLKDADDCRQGVLVSLNPGRVIGVSGDEYICDDDVTVITEHPHPSYKQLEKALSAGLVVERCCIDSDHRDYAWSAIDDGSKAFHESRYRINKPQERTE